MPGPSDTARLRAEAVTRAEAGLGVVRSLLCVLLLGRFVAMGAADHPLRAALVVPPALAVIAFSAVVLVAARRGRVVTGPWLVVSALLDVAATVSSLAADSLYPGDAWRGVFSGPDLALGLVVVAGAGVRMTPGLGVVAGAALAAGAGVVAWLDATASPATIRNTPDEIAMWLVMIGCAAALTEVVGWQSRRLVDGATAHAAALERTRRFVDAVGRSHHDANNGLTTLVLLSDRLLRDIDAGALAEARDTSSRVRPQLDFVRRCLDEVVDATATESALDDVVAPADPALAIRCAVERLASRRVAVETEGAVAAPEVRVPGGTFALERVVVNLLDNAVAGHLGRGASRIAVRVHTRDDHVVIAVEDDGPGLPAAPGRPNGHGIGLRAVAAWAESAGGRLVLDRGAPHGHVEVHLPLGPPT